MIVGSIFCWAKLSAAIASSKLMLQALCAIVYIHIHAELGYFSVVSMKFRNVLQ